MPEQYLVLLLWLAQAASAGAQTQAPPSLVGDTIGKALVALAPFRRSRQPAPRRYSEAAASATLDPATPELLPVVTGIVVGARRLVLVAPPGGPAVVAAIGDSVGPFVVSQIGSESVTLVRAAISIRLILAAP